MLLMTIVIVSCIMNSLQLSIVIVILPQSLSSSFKRPCKKLPNDNLKRFACLFALVSVLVWSYRSYWPQFDISPCSYRCTWPHLISVLGLTNPLGRKLISAFVLTSHLKCYTILLIFFLGSAFLNNPRLFLFSISLIFVISHCNIGLIARKNWKHTQKLHSE